MPPKLPRKIANQIQTVKPKAPKTTTSATVTNNKAPTSKPFTEKTAVTTNRTTTSAATATTTITATTNNQVKIEPIVKIQKTNLVKGLHHHVPGAVQRNAALLKSKELIRVSIHGTKNFSNAEMKSVLSHLRVDSIAEIDSNIAVAFARTGSLQHVKNITNEQCTNINTNDTFKSEFDQKEQATGAYIDMEMGTYEKRCKSTQACGEDVDREIKALRMAFAPAMVNIPALNELQDPIIYSQTKPRSIYFNPKAFKNYTETPIPENVAIILSMGPKFSVPVYYNSKDFKELKEAANLINDTFGNPNNKDAVREHIINHIKKYEEAQRNGHRSEITDFFHQALRDTKKFLNNNPNIIATQADKANCSIIMDKQTYTNKVENLLRNIDNYAPLTNTSTAAYMSMNQKILDKMEKANLISKITATSAKIKEDKPANMYAFIKTHKENAPPRPIVNTRGSMGYAAAEAVTNILNRARENGKYNVINSTQAVEIIKNTDVCPDEKFQSLDVMDMFTNIPTDRAITSVRKRQKKLNLNNEQMAIIIEVIVFVCQKSTEISFNGRYFKQIKGLKMGSSLSPILADFVMEDLLDQAFLSIEKPIMIMKYVDDILFIATEEEGKVLLDNLNKADKNIKFQYEIETNGSINYLDFTVMNKAQNESFRVTTKWYQKHIASGRFLNFLSHHPKSVTINTAIAFVLTMLRNSDSIYHDETIERAKRLMHINSFPDDSIEQIINKATNKYQNSATLNESQLTEAGTSAYGMSVPHIPGLTGKIIKELRSDRITPARPMHKMSKEIFNPSKNSTQKEPTAETIAIIDNLDLTID